MTTFVLLMASRTCEIFKEVRIKESFNNIFTEQDALKYVNSVFGKDYIISKTIGVLNMKDSVGISIKDF